MGIDTVQICYNDGVTGEVCQAPVSITYGEAAYTTTAKHIEGVSGAASPQTGYYQTGGGSVIGDSPLNWNGLIKATGSGDGYDAMTLVFCVYPITLGNTGNWYIFGAESGHIIVGNWDSDGGVWLGARSRVTNTAKSANTTGTGSPSDFGGLVPNQWNSIMVSFRVNGANRDLVVWSNGSEIYNGTWGSGSEANQPMSYSGYCWVGRGDGFTGVPEEGMECYLSYVWCDDTYLDPATYWSSFFDGSNKPKDIGADGSSVTGTQPHTFVPDGDFTNNLGTADNWTAIGTISDAPSSPTD